MEELLTSSCVSNGLNYPPFLYQCVENPVVFASEFEYLMYKMKQYEIKSIEVHNKGNDVDLETYMDEFFDDDDEESEEKQAIIQYMENHDAAIDARDRERSLSRRRGKKKRGESIIYRIK